MKKSAETDVIFALNTRKAKIMLAGTLTEIRRMGLMPVVREGDKEIAIDIDAAPFETGAIIFDKA